MLYRNKTCTTSTDDRAFEQCFVWKNNNIYIMDNHRAALWCWLNEVNKNPETKIRLLHIDNHPDMSPIGLHCKCASKVDFITLTLSGYLNLKHNPSEQHSFKEGAEQVFSYQNFLRFFIQNYSNIIDPKNVFITQHHWETKPDVDPKLTESLSKYLKDVISDSDCSQSITRLYKIDLAYLFETDQNSKWIIDLDFDYFYNEKTNRLNIKLADEVIHYIKEWHGKNKIIALTVAWSPEFLIKRDVENMKQGLERAKELNSIFCKAFELKFSQI